MHKFAGNRRVSGSMQHKYNISNFRTNIAAFCVQKNGHGWVRED